MPRLTDLDPSWRNITGCPYKMLMFQCPVCTNGHYVGVLTNATETKFSYSEGDDAYVWRATNADDFETVSLYPSVDCTKDRNGNPMPDNVQHCRWHGHVQNGNVT